MSAWAATRRTAAAVALVLTMFAPVIVQPRSAAGSTLAATSGWQGRLLAHTALRDLPRLAAAGRAWTVRYLSTAWNGAPTVVSGTVSVPPGNPPAGGWPVVSFGHGFGGIADGCAPSRTGPGAGERVLQDALLGAGFAVVVTDFDGIGTPGESSVIDGASEANAMIDIIRAGRQLAPLARSWAAVGYSMGGHAALFAAWRADAYAPELRHLGTVALAPMTQWRLQLTAPPVRDPLGPVNPVLPFITRTASVTHADVYRPQEYLTAEGMRLYHLAGQVCLEGMATAVAGLTNGDVFDDPAAASDAFAAMYTDQEVPAGHYRRPVRIAHGSDDQIPPVLSQLTVDQLAGAGSDATLTLVAGTDHLTVVPRFTPQAVAWVDGFFAAGPWPP